MSKILLVDDEPNVRLVYREVLTEKGHEVFEAESGEETFKILNSENVELVVLDIKLRLESGLSVLQKITKEFPDIPVVLCSAYVSFQNDYTSWLAKSYVVKSSDPDEFLKEVNNALGEKIVNE
ncbi:MAG TPA: response regulator [Thermodesulfobacteriota bacterium]|nr:response regulator [Thermodesulfobacteriota bacterium]